MSYYKGMPELKVVIDKETKRRKLNLRETWRYILMTGMRVLEKRKGIKSPEGED